MRFLSGLALILALLFMVSCSSADKSPSAPSSVNPGIDLAGIFDGNTVDFNPADTEGWQPAFFGMLVPDGKGGFNVVEDREAMANYNITSLILNTHSLTVDILNISGNLIEADLTINNPTSMLVFDVRIIFNNIGGNKIVNPDSYTTLFSRYISPYIAFAKSDMFRLFPIGPGATDTQRLFLEYAGGNIGFTIAATMPDNCEEPFELNSVNLIGQLDDETGGEATLTCKVQDHQWNLDFIAADLRLFTGQIQYLVADPERPDNFEIMFSNTLLAPGGTYPTWVGAKSIGSNLLCYNKMDINVAGGIDPPVVTITTPAEDPFTTSDRFTPIAGTIDNFEGTEAILEVNGDQQTIPVENNAFNEMAVLNVGENTIIVYAEGPGGIGSDSVMVNCNATSANIWVRLTWDQDDTDVDLYVTEPGPSRFTCWYANKVSPDTHAQLDLDDVTGYGPEHYFLSEGAGHHLFHGKYEIDVHYYSDHGTGRTCLSTILVYKDDLYFGEFNHIMPISNPGEAGPQNRRTGKTSWWDSVADVVL